MWRSSEVGRCLRSLLPSPLPSPLPPSPRQPSSAPDPTQGRPCVPVMAPEQCLPRLGAQVGHGVAWTAAGRLGEGRQEARLLREPAGEG